MITATFVFKNNKNNIDISLKASTCIYTIENKCRTLLLLLTHFYFNMFYSKLNIYIALFIRHLYIHDVIAL